MSRHWALGFAIQTKTPELPTCIVPAVKSCQTFYDLGGRLYNWMVLVDAGCDIPHLYTLQKKSFQK